MTKTSPSDERLRASVEALHQSLQDLPKRYDIHLHPVKSLFFHFLKGIAYGVGFLVGVAIVVPVVVSLLRSVQWGPVVGKIMNEAVRQMDQTRSASR